MNRKVFLMDLRKQGRLKGQKPCFIVTKFRIDRLYSGKFIMSMRDTTLYFQKIGLFFERLYPKDDFSIQALDYVCYKQSSFKARKIVTLYKKNGEFIDLEYMVGTRETFSTEDNMERILKTFETLGIHKMEGLQHVE